MSRRRWLIALGVWSVLAAFVTVPAVASPVPSRYTVNVEINGYIFDPIRDGLTGQKAGYATGVSNTGTLVGYFEYHPRDFSTEAWANGPLPVFLPGGLSTQATASNAAGEVVGSGAVFGLGEFTPAAWNGGAITPLFGSYLSCATDLRNCEGTASDINSGGDIVGSIISNLGDPAHGIPPAPFGFLVDSAGIHRLPFQVATAINDHGDIVGATTESCCGFPAPQALLYSGGIVTDLSPIFGASTPADINNNGDIVGGDIVYNIHTGIAHHIGITAKAINNQGDVVGGTDIYAGGHVADLNTLVTGFTGTIMSANDINDSGQIAADVLTPDGVQHGALLTPVTDDTPPTCVLMATVAGPPKQLKIAVQDTGTGIQSITHQEDNATVDVPSFGAGTNDPLMITATKTHSGEGSTVSLAVRDAAGNKTVCDPRWPAIRRKHRVG